VTIDHIFIAAPYLDLPRVDADCEVLQRLLDDPAPPDDVDWVSLGQEVSGEVRFHREHDRDCSPGPAASPSRGLAAGLALALFPSIAGDIPASEVVEREMLGAVAGVVAGALGRAALHELGLSLDSFPAGLIATTTPAGEQRVCAALTNAQSSMPRRARVDVEAIEWAVELIVARRRPHGAR